MVARLGAVKFWYLIELCYLLDVVKCVIFARGFHLGASSFQLCLMGSAEEPIVFEFGILSLREGTIVFVSLFGVDDLFNILRVCIWSKS